MGHHLGEYSPTFSFLPADPDYFIAREKEDRKRRQELGRRESTIPTRLCPTVETYQAHQIHGGVPGAELGGLRLLDSLGGNYSYSPSPLNTLLPKLDQMIRISSNSLSFALLSSL
jgi:hypothetical protein